MPDPTNPREWLRRALSNLARASHSPGDPRVLLADLCFDAQQAAEKALKAVLVLRSIPFPRTHSLPELIDLLTAHAEGVPEEVREAAGLTRYAVATRYPGFDEDVESDDWREAVDWAERVVRWGSDRVMEPVADFVSKFRRMSLDRTRERHAAMLICETLSVEWTLDWLDSRGLVTSQLDLRAGRDLSEGDVRHLHEDSGRADATLWLVLDRDLSRAAANLLYWIVETGEINIGTGSSYEPSSRLPVSWRLFGLIGGEDFDVLASAVDGPLAPSKFRKLAGFAFRF
ncbi:MAG: HEPN domain-containing protein [Deltaproteobacteria bacterium]|nr:HEPN domain-containing protein [Deltaproteobacteria bacterium]